LNKFLYTALLLLLPLIQVKSQLIEYEKFVQLSGIIRDKAYNPVQGVAVISKKLHRAAISENTGIYSITSTPGDTVYFRAIGFKRYHTVIPVDYQSRHCMADVILEADTIMINEVKILPWRTYSEFLADVTKDKPQDPKVVYMNENIASIYVAISNEVGVGISPEAGYRYAMEQNFTSMTNRNMAVPYNNLFNPIAWVRFINGAKNGLLRNKTYTKPEPAKVIKKKKKAVRK